MGRAKATARIKPARLRPVHNASDDRVRTKPKDEVCERCGRVHPRCHGHHHIYDKTNQPWKLIGIEPCGSWPMHGQSVCGTHGGRGRNRKAAERQWQLEQTRGKAMSKLEQTVRTLGLPVTTTPQQALLDELYRTAGAVAWLESEVGKLKPDELTWGIATEEKREGIGEMETHVDLTTTVRAAKPAVLLELYHRERSHLIQVAKVAIQCGIAERQVKLAEEQGRAIADALRSAFEDPELELSVTQLTIARTVAARVLRSVSIGGSVGGSRPVPQLEVLNGQDKE